MLSNVAPAHASVHNCRASGHNCRVRCATSRPPSTYSSASRYRAGLTEGADVLAHGHDELLAQLFRWLHPLVQRHVRINALQRVQASFGRLLLSAMPQWIWVGAVRREKESSPGTSARSRGIAFAAGVYAAAAAELS